MKYIKGYSMEDLIFESQNELWSNSLNNVFLTIFLNFVKFLSFVILLNFVLDQQLVHSLNC